MPATCAVAAAYWPALAGPVEQFLPLFRAHRDWPEASGPAPAKQDRVPDVPASKNAPGKNCAAHRFPVKPESPVSAKYVVVQTKRGQPELRDFPASSQNSAI